MNYSTVSLFILILVVSLCWTMMVRGQHPQPSGNFVYKIEMEDDNAPCNKMRMYRIKAYQIHGENDTSTIGSCIPSIDGQYYKVSCNKERGIIKSGCNKACSYCLNDDSIIFQNNACGMPNGGCGILPFSSPILWSIQYAKTPDNERGDCSTYPVNLQGEPIDQCVKSRGVFSDWEFSILHCNATSFRKDVSDQKCGGPNKYSSVGKLNECKYNMVYNC